ncbi:NADP oxidoreductase [Brevibacterium permense]|uniref:NADPH-dependent F420 reductase n=1 Tax=Brevibacterium permense TaxID=234834 RepID=UPI0021D39A7C|nr:NAD(P)-binding domain-containing protein [Brevibacterium permense]MCU4297165.1 NADP oxidoreductase [Brevibacterium permense]
MNQIGIIGSGAIGKAIAHLAVDAGIQVTIANSRGTETLTDLVADLGANAHSGTTQEAAAFSDLVVLAIPLAAYERLPHAALNGKTILSTGNYYPHRDGRIQVLDTHEMTTAELEQTLLPGARVVKAFNNIVAHHIPLLANSEPRTALPVFGDDPRAKDEVTDLVRALGFHPIDAGSLSESWRAEPESGAYTAIYAEGPDGFGDDYLADRGRPLTADELEKLLAASHRPDVAARKF